MRPTTLGTAFATLAAPTPRYATVYVGPSSGCASNVGGPVVHATISTPIAGRPFRFDWSVEALQPPAVAVSLLVSLRDLPQPIIPGASAPGCRLMVHPDYLLVPGSELLTYTPATGVVSLNWTPPVELVGTVFRTQLLVARPNANGLGHLLSAPVHFEVGTR
jgi:hypothetical protein